MQHVIKKQVLEISLATDRDMFKVQQKAGQYYYSHVLPALEKILNGLTDENHVIQIDHLEIDLGAVEWDYAQQEMNVSGLYQKIEKEIRKTVEEILDQQYVQNKYEKGSATLEKSATHHACRQWLCYMRNGYLPWNITAVNGVWHLQVLEALATDYKLVAELKELLQKDGNALRRLVNDHSIAFLVKLTEVITAQQQQLLTKQFYELEQSLHPADYTNLSSPDRPPVKNAVLLWQQLLKDIAGGISSVESINKLKDQSVTDLIKKDVSPVIKEDSVNIAGDKKEAGGIPEEGVFAPHAGLILLHPFLKSFFSHTHLIEAGKFTNVEMQEKAIWLLHFIASGKEEAEEHQLAVPKIICGYGLEQSPASIILTEADKKEAEDLMVAVIDQWTILKNTSADGLREGFLQRTGKIYYKNGNLCFAVEPHAIDVLLDHLPWNLSIVKLPWIKELIQVEWR
ncbi:MAG: contractile injection system tape measure protein [Chitinophagaceae bacterium]